MDRGRMGRDGQFITARVAYGFVGLVALSSGLMAGTGGATAVEIALLSGLGVVVGLVLLLGIGLRPWSE